MFTIEQIKAAHNKVRSGNDFPAYIREIKDMGVEQYEVAVVDGAAIYYGANSYRVSTGIKYEKLDIAIVVDVLQFMEDLKAHQQGRTDYFTFCSDCAKSGIEKWVIEMDKMTCTYFDFAGNRLLTEVIPQ